jgi:dTDP-4-dehydrorhamnose reductase
MMRIMVTGAAGQLGSTVTARLSGTGEIHPFTHAQLDIADEAAVLAAVASVRAEAVINCAAYNDVDGAEDAAAAALSANALGVLSLARAATAAGATLVHYSTDFVFDGNVAAPYVETDAPRPLSTYGASKLLGEWFALEAPAAYVLRVESLFGGHPAKSSVDRILAAIRAKQPVRVLADRTVTPSYVDDVAAATERLLTSRAPYGVYHCVNSGTATWLEIAEEAVRLLRTDAAIVPVSVNAMKLKAGRPKYSALSNDKLERTGVAMPTWKDALSRHLANAETRAASS